MKRLIFSALYELRRHPLVGSITILATAFAIFLIMIVVMMDNVENTAMPPETNRDRLAFGISLHVSLGDGEDQSSSPNYATARRFYSGLEGVEIETFFSRTVRSAIEAQDKAPVMGDYRNTDAAYFKVFDHTFVAGRPYTSEEVESAVRLAVITETIADRLYGSPENALGKEILVSKNPFKVVGVVKDPSSLANFGASDVFIRLREKTNESDLDFGNAYVAMKMRDGVTIEQLRSQVEQRYEKANIGLDTLGIKLLYHQQPFDYKQAVSTTATNVDPESGMDQSAVILVLLLLVPAINLSSTTRSRMRSRVSEIGVRRAFGCTRPRIFLDLFAENFVITLIGSAIGLVFAVCFGYFFADAVFRPEYASGDSFSLPFTMIFNLKVFGWALFYCFILNLVSTSIPAWKAARVSPVEAINKKK